MLQRICEWFLTSGEERRREERRRGERGEGREERRGGGRKGGEGEGERGEGRGGRGERGEERGERGEGRGERREGDGGWLGCWSVGFTLHGLIYYIYSTYFKYINYFLKHYYAFLPYVTTVYINSQYLSKSHIILFK